MITISKKELVANGYLHIISQDDETVILRNVNGSKDLYAIRESYSGWCIETEDGRLLEFCSNIKE